MVMLKLLMIVLVVNVSSFTDRIGILNLPTPLISFFIKLSGCSPPVRTIPEILGQVDEICEHIAAKSISSLSPGVIISVFSRMCLRAFLGSIAAIIVLYGMFCKKSFP